MSIITGCIGRGMLVTVLMILTDMELPGLNLDADTSMETDAAVPNFCVLLHGAMKVRYGFYMIMIQKCPVLRCYE